MSNAQSPALIKASLRHRFYAAVIFLSAVTQAYTNNRQSSPNSAQWNGESPQEAAFKDFVNKLSQFCDVRPGGDSVTAFTILNLHDHFEYRFACNRLKKNILTKVSAYVTDLLETLHHVQQDDNFRSLLLGKVLCFCRTRVHHYLVAFKKACRACEATQPADSRLRDQLRHCLQAAVDADFKNMPEDQWVPLCEALMVIIEEYYRNPDVNIFANRGSQGVMSPGSNCWSELRHYAGRLRSFSQGIGTLIAAAQIFPMLFESFQVEFVPSSNPDNNPMQKRMPADKILRTMVQPVDTAKYIALFEGTRSLSHNVNETIQDMMTDKNFKPIVHAELLVLQSLEKGGLTHQSFFFNSWRYIGSSKSTCRLCYHYFQAHPGGFKVRPTHGNLYINWKPPDVLQRDGEEAIRERERMLNTIVVPIRKDALRTLDDQVPLGRQHDSSTGMTAPVRAMASRGSATGLSGTVTDDDMETSFGD